MKINITIDINQKLVDRLLENYGECMGVTEEEIVKVVTKFAHELESTNRLVDLIDALDLFNY